MNGNTLTLEPAAYPDFLRNIPAPPKRLYYRGPLLELLALPRLAVVGSRKVSAYGRSVTGQLASEAASRGVVIVSGLAFGVDSIAHQAALEVSGKTIAVLPSSVDLPYPVSHRQLAQRILDKGGALVSEYAATPSVRREYFIARNRLISGLSDATLITEAALKSGSLHTARFALEQGREVLAVPGNITSVTSIGTNNLIRAGAVPITSVEDLMFALNIHDAPGSLVAPKGDNDAEQAILDLLAHDMSDGELLLAQSGLGASEFSQTLTMLEITGKIRRLGANQWSL
jgi:DNA processing protein